MIIKKIKLNEINPENAILLGCIVSGLLSSIILFLLLALPLIKQNNLINKDIKEYKDKKSKILIKKIEYKKLLDISNKLNDDNSFLINLIGGTKNLNTFLTALNNIAINNQVEIIKYEPKEVVSFKKVINNEINSKQNSSSIPPPIINNNQINDNEVNKDPFLIVPELEKHVINISLKGNYPEILNFIKDIELLKNIVTMKNFEIIGLSDFSKTEFSEIQFSTNFSAYGIKK